MINDKFLKLTNTVYRILEFFPESDPLKNRAKDKALAIMEHLVLVNETHGWASFHDPKGTPKVKVQLLEDIDILLGYLWIGKSQGWLNSINCLIIVNEYEKIKQEIVPVIELAPLGSPESVLNDTESKTPDFSTPILSRVLDDKVVGISGRQHPPSYEITARQRKILEFLSKNEKAQVMDLQTILPDITKRTIRRDLDELLQTGKIIRLGDFNQVFYKIS